MDGRMTTKLPFSLSSALTGELPHIHIVDIGANPIDGPAPYSPLLKSGLASLVGFEPNLEALAALNARKTDAETYLPYAVGDGREGNYHRCASPGMNSLLRPNKELLKYLHGFVEWGEVESVEPIQTHRLDDIEEVSSIDMLKIDIQGAELSVFQNGERKLRDALVIHTEVEFLPLYEGQPLFSEVDFQLRSLGFVIHRFEPLTSRALKPLQVNGDPYAGFSQIIWADAVYVKNFMEFDSLDTDKMLKLAVIMFDVYGSVDMALLALLAADRKLGTNHASALKNAIISE